MPTRERAIRGRTDDELFELIREHAAAPSGVSPVIVKNRLDRYPDRKRAAELIERMVKTGELHKVARGNCKRCFSTREAADRWAPGRGVSLDVMPSKAAPAKKPSAAKLHDKLDPMGRPGTMPTGFALSREKADKVSRRVIVGSQAAPVRAEPRITVCPSGNDRRYTVRELPPGYRSALDPRECRAWAASATQGATS